MKEWRLLDTGAGDCYRNMAVDEAILADYIDNNTIPTLRIYSWYPQAFSLGYFQDPFQELDLKRCKQENISFVRRRTGGGVIFHKSELTYSLVCAQDEIDSAGIYAKEIFRVVSSFLINVYRALGLDAEFALDKTPCKREGWFCFSSRERYDILISGKKIGGNAQRRNRDIIFQHGSIPLSPCIDEAKKFLKQGPSVDKSGICSLYEALGREIGYGEFKDVIMSSFSNTFSVKLLAGELNYREEESIRRLERDKYRTPAWNLFRDGNSNRKIIPAYPAKGGQAAPTYLASEYVR